MKTILVIDDNLEVCDNLKELFQLHGYHVVTAANGRIGLERVLNNPPDLVICDVNMPEMNGVEVLRYLNRLPVSRHIPFIFLTAYMDEAAYITAIEENAEAYIVKPFITQKLLELVEQIIGR
jgi:CheY-like chemotaxis protein